MDFGGQNYMEEWYYITFYAYLFKSCIFLCFRYANYMLISYYANKKSSPRLPSWQPSSIFFNTPIESGTIIKPCTLKHFQVTYMLHKAGYWTRWWSLVTLGCTQAHKGIGPLVYNDGNHQLKSPNFVDIRPIFTIEMSYPITFLYTITLQMHSHFKNISWLNQRYYGSHFYGRM